MMTDDELSELAEALEDACREHGRVSADRLECACPLGAMYGGAMGEGYEFRWRPFHNNVPLPSEIYFGFVRGFQGHSLLPGDTMFPNGDPRAYELGKLFRRAYP